MVYESRYPGNHKGECQYLMIDCPHSDCEERALRKDMPAHEVACPHRIVDCHLACPAQYAAKDEAAHLQVCPKVVVACPRSCGQDHERGKLPDHEGECTATIGCPTRTQKAHLAEHEEHCHAQAALAREAADELDAARDEVAALKKQLADMQKAAGAAPSASPVPLSDAASPPDAAGIEAAEDLFRRATSASPDDVKDGIDGNIKADLDQLGGEDDPNEEDAAGNDVAAPQHAHDLDNAADLVEGAASNDNLSDVPLPPRRRGKRMAPLHVEDDEDDLAPAQRRRLAVEEELTDEE
ncbi:hypothetical protein Rhopal_000707-T1 [Rhodotorula paludigena]|uniref:TRAF-type domain-containing protein n=1 Tax=Rhodotorula paludigena TaxID=86838 RepID=A0AAV5GEJ4_9BASI|nr:hypothetical protein Rhopal_000707-T1 [Rhodotorula paludigena]